MTPPLDVVRAAAPPERGCNGRHLVGPSDATPPLGGREGMWGRIAALDNDSRSLQDRCNLRAPVFGIRKKTVKPSDLGHCCDREDR
jgi:hypothetical protein